MNDLAQAIAAARDGLPRLLAAGECVILTCEHVADLHRRLGAVVAALDSAQPAPPAAVPDGMAERIEVALKRIENGHCIRRIPADPTDPDLVLAEVLAFVQGKPAPFWTPEGKRAAAQRKESGNE